MGDSFTLVTGAGSGIGADIAVRLSTTGPLVLCSRNSSKLNSVLSACANSDSHLIFEQDLSDTAALEAALPEFIKSRGIAISSFVHSAGIDCRFPIKAFDASVFSEMMNVGPLAAAVILKILASRKANSGALKAVALISSVAAFRFSKGHSAYAASKAALVALAKTAALELAPSVRVNLVEPGGVNTPMSAQIFEDEALLKSFEEKIPLGLGAVSDITDAVEFLLSEKSKWITGQTIVVDGGYSL